MEEVQRPYPTRKKYIPVQIMLAPAVVQQLDALTNGDKRGRSKIVRGAVSRYIEEKANEEKKAA